MLPADVEFLAEDPAFDDVIESINAEAFGPGRFARAAYKIREGGPHDRALSFVARRDGVIIASVRMTPIAAGEGRAMLLGPLAVRPAHKSLGIGRRLVEIASSAAREAGEGLVILVGDAPYYGPFGFVRVQPGQIVMPRPVDPMRLLAYELAPGALARFVGWVTHAEQASKSPTPQGTSA